ncbi:hypothetical protein BCM14_0061 [Jezberella montanilacus]|jgi:hypothetical protein|uniref:Uncharacterized protein n=1 Tax=Jezberella montanilacus TaxID=323426 RepID=A0A2T0XRI5_9BURK|nr:hypothetical protein [Jezberella montanilacus]PRZ01551.1 hypothetical protein BCM14_0061 [Jezberella montanilacus]|eukprot:gene11026-11108_t
MSASDFTLNFTEEELIMLGKTADGLSAYMGKSVLAEIGMDDEAEWVIFAIPLGVDEEHDDKAVHVQMGGSGARFVGGRGGLDLDTDIYDCRYLWSIQITDDPEARFVRLDEHGNEFDFSNDLAELLPFETTDEELPDPDLELAEDLGDDQEPEDFEGDDDRGDHGRHTHKGPLH